MFELLFLFLFLFLFGVGFVCAARARGASLVGPPLFTFGAPVASVDPHARRAAARSSRSKSGVGTATSSCEPKAEAPPDVQRERNKTKNGNLKDSNSHTQVNTKQHTNAQRTAIAKCMTLALCVNSTSQRKAYTQTQIECQIRDTRRAAECV